MKKSAMPEAIIELAQFLDVPNIEALLGMAFGLTASRSAEYLADVGTDAFFVMKVGGRLASCAALPAHGTASVADGSRQPT